MRIPLPKIQAAAPAIKKPAPSVSTPSAPTPTEAESIVSERRPSPSRSKIPMKSVSIGKILRPEIEEKKEEQRKELPNKDFTEIDLLATWNEYAELIKNNDLDIYTTLTKNAPTLADNNTIVLKIFNKAQEHDLSEIKAELLAFIRNRLNNFEISLTTFIEKGAAEGVYTSADKYKKLAEKNPLLEELRKKLDLEIGF